MASRKTGVTVAAPEETLSSPAAEATDKAPLKVIEGSNNLPSTDVVNYDDFAGLGREEVRAEDYAIPFLRILQKGSPEVDEASPKYIPGAKAGWFLNTVSGQAFSGKDGLKLIPCLFHREYVEWVPRAAGGGFVASHLPESPVVKTAKPKEPGSRDLVLENGHDLVDTYYQYVLAVAPNGDVFPAVIGFTSTQTKKIRKWNSMMASKRLNRPDGSVLTNPPSFAFFYQATTILEQNDQGTWYGWAIADLNELVPPHDFKEALAFYRSVKSGDVKRAPEGERDAGGGGGIPGYSGRDDEIPF